MVRSDSGFEVRWKRSTTFGTAWPQAQSEVGGAVRQALVLENQCWPVIFTLGCSILSFFFPFLHQKCDFLPQESKAAAGERCPGGWLETISFLVKERSKKLPFAYTLELYMEVKLYSLINGAHLQKALFWPWFQIHVKFHSKTHTPVNFCFNYCLKCWLLKLFFCTSRKDLTKVSCKINTSAIMLFQRDTSMYFECV